MTLRYPKQRKRTNFSLIPYLQACFTKNPEREFPYEYNPPNKPSFDEYRCSQSGHCFLQLILMRLIDFTYISLKLMGIFTIGHLFHTFFQSRICGDIAFGFEEEIEFYYRGIRITGHIDIQVNNDFDEDQYCCDLKSCSPNLFDVMCHAKKADRIQSNLYAFYKGYSYFSIIYISKLTMEMKEFFYMVDELAVIDYLQQIYKANYHGKQCQLMKVPFDTSKCEFRDAQNNVVGKCPFFNGEKFNCQRKLIKFDKRFHQITSEKHDQLDTLIMIGMDE